MNTMKKIVAPIAPIALIASAVMLGGCLGDESITDEESGVLAEDLAAEMAAAVDVVWITFDVGVIGQPIPASIPSAGAEPDIEASMVLKNGGQALVASGRVGNGRAIDLPTHDGASTGPRAVVKVIDNDVTDGDALSPGTATFTFGADFNLDATSSSTS